VISVLINGVPQAFPPTSSFVDLVTTLNLTGKRVAIECNGEIVPRSQFPQRLLADGDKIEIVVAVGGG
jgi:sulfur carrier protein